MAIDKAHLADAARYVLMNSVRAKLCPRPQNSRWSSVAAHFAGDDDELVEVAPLLERFGIFGHPRSTADKTAIRALRGAELSGWPTGSGAWLAGLEALSGRSLAPRKRGPEPRGNSGIP